MHMLHIHNNLYVSLTDVEQERRRSQPVDQKIVLIPFNSVHCCEENSCEVGKAFQPSYLSAIYNFDAKIRNISAKCDGCKLVFSTSELAVCRVKLAFLLGCHMIMTHGIGFEETFLAIRQLFKLVGEGTTMTDSVGNSLRAFCSAKCLNWIEFSKILKKTDGNQHTIDMEEFDHYSRSNTCKIDHAYGHMLIRWSEATA